MYRKRHTSIVYEVMKLIEILFFEVISFLIPEEIYGYLNIYTVICMVI